MSRAFSTGHHPLGTDLRMAVVADADDVARLLFERGGIDAVHINSNVITVTLGDGATTAGLKEIIEGMYTFYRPGVAVPSFDAPPSEGGG